MRCPVAEPQALSESHPSTDISHQLLLPCGRDDVRRVRPPGAAHWTAVQSQGVLWATLLTAQNHATLISLAPFFFFLSFFSFSFNVLTRVLKRKNVSETLFDKTKCVFAMKTPRSSGQQNTDYAAPMLHHSVPPARSCRRGEQENIPTCYLATCALMLVGLWRQTQLVNIPLALTSFPTGSIPSKQHRTFFKRKLQHVADFIPSQNKA